MEGRPALQPRRGRSLLETRPTGLGRMMPMRTGRRQRRRVNAPSSTATSSCGSSRRVPREDRTWKSLSTLMMSGTVAALQ